MNEDEHSYVLEGRMGAQLGDEVVYAEVGYLVFKPSDQWHTFWNAGDEPCRILEIISLEDSSICSRKRPRREAPACGTLAMTLDLPTMARVRAC